MGDFKSNYLFQMHRTMKWNAKQKISSDIDDVKQKNLCAMHGQNEPNHRL